MTTDGTDPPAADDLDRGVSGMLRIRRVVIGVLVTVFLALPAMSLFAKQGLSGDAAFLVPGTAVFVVLVDRWVLVSLPQPSYLRRLDMVILGVIVVLGAALFAVGQMNWLIALAVAAAAAGRFAATRPRAAIGVAACAAVGVAVSVWYNLGYGAALAAIGVPLLGGLFAYSAERRNVLFFKLSQARAELARMAVAEERLRISRDLHDLLGHSLSVITLKSELAGRMIGSDPQRAAKEIAELEAVARRSLAEVRQAVTSYRQPSLAAELAAARRVLASAGIDCRVDAPGTYTLPPEVDALLAWTVREGSTNIVRHSGAQHAVISVTVTPASVSAELTDDGAGPPAAPGMPTGGGAAAGSGLAGLAERAARLGGTLQAGAGSRGGFRVRVTVPLIMASPADRRESPAATAAPGTGPGASPVPGASPAGQDAPDASDAPGAPDAAPAAPAAPGQVPR
ncbi:MAG TPA: histidine kinase [Streptosporangiaceae bacterium]|nr:histidine kinase [Streptosporangiaceae bacterium]